MFDVRVQITGSGWEKRGPSDEYRWGVRLGRRIVERIRLYRIIIPWRVNQILAGFFQISTSSVHDLTNCERGKKSLAEENFDKDNISYHYIYITIKHFIKKNSNLSFTWTLLHLKFNTRFFRTIYHY